MSYQPAPFVKSEFVPKCIYTTQGSVACKQNTHNLDAYGQPVVGTENFMVGEPLDVVPMDIKDVFDMMSSYYSSSYASVPQRRS